MADHCEPNDRTCTYKTQRGNINIKSILILLSFFSYAFLSNSSHHVRIAGAVWPIRFNAAVDPAQQLVAAPLHRLDSATADSPPLPTSPHDDDQRPHADDATRHCDRHGTPDTRQRERNGHCVRPVYRQNDTTVRRATSPHTLSRLIDPIASPRTHTHHGSGTPHTRHATAQLVTTAAVCTCSIPRCSAAFRHRAALRSRRHPNPTTTRTTPSRHQNQMNACRSSSETPTIWHL